MDRVEALLAQMTIEEKVGQLNLATAGQLVTGPQGAGDVVENIRAGNVGAVFNIWGRDAHLELQKCAVEETRLGVPLFFGLDVLHGHRTIFPIPLAEACVFDPSLWERTAHAAAQEAACDGIDLTFAPMLDVSRDPRWGRIAEGPGEDPFVAMAFAEAKVRGFQGADLADATAIAATAKHFCAGGAATAGRDYAPVDISERMLREVYLPPFAAAARAGCAAIMPGFNSVAGVPMTAATTLLRDDLRGKLGFEGVIVSDYAAIPELIEHGVAGDVVEAAALALKAGVDMDMVSGAYLRLPEALTRGLVRLADIDAAVRRVLVLKQKLGLLDNPFRRLSGAGPRCVRTLALEAARRAIVLLANDGTLPLSPAVKRIAVVGPLADARFDMLGPWAAAGAGEACVTILDGLRNSLEACEILYAPGGGVDAAESDAIEEAGVLCEQVELVVLCVGEAAWMSGEAASRASLDLPGRQRELAERVLATGKPVVAVLSSGRPLTTSWLMERARAVLATWFLGDRAGEAIADVATGRFNPSGRLAVSWPRDVGQIPISYGERSSGRPFDPVNPFTSRYLDSPNEPLFAFGYGLSYARVVLSDLRIEPAVFRRDETVRVSVNARNEDECAVESTIFLFLRDRVASVARPSLELKAWKKISLAAKEAGMVSFSLQARDFGYLSQTFAAVVEAGDFDIYVGLDARRSSLLTARASLV